MLLDEPTNHLDISAIEWLENFLSAYRGSFIVISHDRYFLDKVTNRTMELKDRRLFISKGNYSRHLELRSTARELEMRQYLRTKKEIKRIEGIVEQQRRWGQERNFITAASKQKQADRLKATLVEPERDSASIHFHFEAKEVGGNDVLAAKKLAKSFDGKLVFRNVDMLIKKGEKVFLLGDNGCGKTTLASIIANTTRSNFVKLNAVTSGVKEVREVIAEAENNLRLYGKETFLLLDECHRWSKAQSDSVLPALESGTIKFIGSTTENPMISMTGAIVSRCRLFQFYPLSEKDVMQGMTAALNNSEKGLGMYKTSVDEAAMMHIARIANGDVRCALNALELAVRTTEPSANGVIHITAEIAAESIQQKVIKCDEQQLYDMLSAFCKSLRGGDSNAALAWFARLIYAGLDPRIICRRIIAHASEDVGMANPTAMQQAVAAAQSLELIGMPEARLSIAQAIVFVCESPKSNSIVLAVDGAFAEAEKTIDEPVPIHLRDTSYKGAKQLGHGAGYKYPHDYPNHEVEQKYMPPSVEGHVYYVPTDMGIESRIKQTHERKGRI